MANKRINRILITVCGTVIAATIILFVITLYRGDDGMTFQEERILNEEGIVVSKEPKDAEWQTGEYGADPFMQDNTVSGNSNDKNNSTNSSSGTSNNNGNSSSNGNGSTSSNGSSSSSGGKMTYEKYMAMSPSKQQAYFESFKSPEAFIAWFNKAKAEYEAKDDSIKVEGGGFDVGDYQ